MNERIFPLLVLAIAFLVSLGSLAFVSWNIVSNWEIATIVFSVLTGFATVLVAYYVYKDYENTQWRIDRAENEDTTLQNLIERLEGIVDDNFDLVTNKLEKLEKTVEKKQP